MQIDESTLFAGLPPEVTEALAEHLVPVEVESGAVLMREGDPADGLYLVRAGRLQARRGAGDSVTVLGDVVRGEVVGESALVADQPRSATVVALRDSELLHLPVAGFERVVAAHPTFLRPVAAQVVERMMSAGRGDHAVRRPDTVAILPAHDTPAARDGVAELAAALSRVVGNVVVADAAAGTRRTADGTSDARWAHELEAANDLVVYVGSTADDAWTQRCLRQSDVAVVVADASVGTELTLADRLAGEHHVRRSLPTELVLVHPNDRVRPAGTQRWLERRPVRRHHHVRLGTPADHARVARLLTNQGIGLVLSGGGARSMAAIGVVEVMAGLGIPVDAVGGTSAGAVVAGAVAQGWPPDRIEEVLRRGTVANSNPIDLTLPVASLAAGRRISDRLREAAGEACIEDLWIDYFCVSTNLSRNEPKVHRRGLGWRAVRASTSIPGIFPPVADGGDVLVDGGLTDNLPVAEMRRGHEGITVIAVDVGVRRGISAGDLPDSTVVHGLRLLVDRLHPRRRAPRITGLFTVLAGLTELGGRHGDAAGDRGDLFVRPEVERFPMLDFSAFDKIVETGRAAATAVLGPWWEERHDP